MGMTYDKNSDILTILDHAVVHMAPTRPAPAPPSVTAGARCSPARAHRRFERGVKVTRDGQVIEADSGTAHLTDDEEQLESLELRGSATITSTQRDGRRPSRRSPARTSTLKYAADGQTIEHALITGDASIQLAGEAAEAGRQITASTIDITLGARRPTPTALTARDTVQLTLPAEERGAWRARSRRRSLDARRRAGPRPDAGAISPATSSSASGAPPSIATARSARLDVALKPGLSAIDEARVLARRAVRGSRSRRRPRPAARYVVDKGTLDADAAASPAARVPHVVNDQIAVDAARIDVDARRPDVKRPAT